MKLEETSTIDKKQANRVRDSVRATVEQAHKYKRAGQNGIKDIIQALGGWSATWFIPVPKDKEKFTPEAQLNQDY